MERYKISKLSNDSTVSKFVPKIYIECLSLGQYSVDKNVMFMCKNIRFNLKIKLL